MAGKHPNDQELLMDLNRRCSELDSRRIRAHLSGCAFCRRRLSALLDIELALEELPLLKAPDELVGRVLRDLNGGQAAPAEDGASSAGRTEARPVTGSPVSGPGWKRELTNGMLAIAATYLFIASGIVGKISSLSTQELESGVRLGASQLSQAVEAVSRHLLS
ncbi:hypothetical protein SAMN02799630_05342 [Paenibacillus sp. UNCCL117]|uniref:hypothetical protein n=1 Tax=unclassified Paenibacillus TaxID=185978 RepID=UPI000883901E|nr:MULTISPECIES: hypothetical protein [unclassified Paenibacillus]SDE39957.1 hypothetical protein SAMN04488602_12711 [Paenibacillus sp. cl123]SFW65277.1 hypothetical protein SAMN02799630_05342 [Paenibacillus sp. UNCCL117]